MAEAVGDRRGELLSSETDWIRDVLFDLEDLGVSNNLDFEVIPRQ